MIRTARTALSAGLLLGLAAPMAIAGHHEGGHAATPSQADIVETEVAAVQFETLAAAAINIEMISTSPIRTSCIIRRDQVEPAVVALHTAFGLDEKEATAGAVA